MPCSSPGRAAWRAALPKQSLILGHRNFSGKLADTFAGSLSTIPSSTASFHESGSYVNYTEDIYVGYRYFETLPGEAAKVVSYPFGFGLSYTDFAIFLGGGAGATDGTQQRQRILSATEGEMLMRSSKAHCHEHRGLPGARGGAALYFPPRRDSLGKPARQLVRHHKIWHRFPGNSEETGAFTFDVSEMASYDDTGRIQKSSWVLRAGRLCTVPWHGCAKCQEANLCLSLLGTRMR